MLGLLGVRSDDKDCLIVGAGAHIGAPIYGNPPIVWNDSLELLLRYSHMEAQPSVMVRKKKKSHLS